MMLNDNLWTEIECNALTLSFLKPKNATEINTLQTARIDTKEMTAVITFKVSNVEYWDSDNTSGAMVGSNRKNIEYKQKLVIKSK